MLLAEDHEVVDALAADRANRPLGKAVLAGAAAEIGLSWIPIVFIRRLTMVGYPILDAELAKPPICQIDLHLGAQPPLRADCKHASHNQHPDHQHRIDRRPTYVPIVGRKLLCTQSRSTAPSICLIEMIHRHHLVEIERVEEVALATLPPPHYRPLRRIAVLSQRNHGLKRSLNESFASGLAYRVQPFPVWSGSRQ